MLMRPPEELPQDFTAVKKFVDSVYLANQSLWQIYWSEAMIDCRLEAGDVSLAGELNPNLQLNKGSQFYFNKVRPLCNTVSGYQRKNRKTSTIIPLENGDQETADQWTKILMGIFKREGVYETISDAFHQGACVTGMNLLHIYLDFSKDPVSGDIKVDNLPFNAFFIDPYFRKLDLSDCSFVWRRSYLSHAAVANLLPDHYAEIMGMNSNPAGIGRSGRFQYMPEALGQSQQNRLAYDEFYYRSYRKQKLLVDKQTGEILDITKQDNIDIDRFLEENPQVTLIDQEIPTVDLAILVQDKCLYCGPQPTGLDCFPFVPVVGYYNEMLPYFYSRIQGLCRSLRDPQLLFNRRLVLSMDLLESQLNSGFIFKENAVIDVKHLFQTGQGRVIPIKKGYEVSDVIQIQPPQVPPSHFQVLETLGKLDYSVTGITEELMGQIVDSRDSSGYQSFLRQRAGLVTLQPIFDRLDYSQKLLSERIMQIVQNNYTPGKIKLLLEGKEPAPLFYNKAFGKYHCSVEAGFDTETQKQMQFAQLMQLREMGVEIPTESLIEAATLQNKTELIKKIQDNQQQSQQIQQAQTQAQIQLQQSQAELSKARAIADRGLGLERASRVKENEALAVERRAEANKEDELALLNKVKLLKEIDDIDLGHLERLINLANSLKEREIATSEQQVEKESPKNEETNQANTAQ
jgi:hypothetical protein